MTKRKNPKPVNMRLVGISAKDAYLKIATFDDMQRRLAETDIQLEEAKQRIRDIYSLWEKDVKRKDFLEAKMQEALPFINRSEVQSKQIKIIDSICRREGIEAILELITPVKGEFSL